MNPAQLLAHFDRISEAPNAVLRLRRFVLDLAVRGKLVEQDPNDEPASELLKHIQAEKAQLVKKGIFQEQKPLAPIKEEETDFDLPKGWKWVRMADVIKLWNGYAFQSGDFQAKGVPVIRIGDLQGGDVVLSSAVCVPEAIANSVGPEVWIPPGALLIAMSGATTGKVAINRTGVRLLLNQRVGRIEVFLMSIDFIRIFLDTIVARNLSISFGTAIPNLSAKQINETVVPFPPLAEQHRIVAKVDELMALCDRLEAAQAKKENRRDRLVAASLNRLNNGTDAQSFFEHARFHLSHLPRLTTRPAHIQQLRQTLLNLAVRGQLVHQDPNDEPASELLKRIQAEKTHLIKEGKMKPQQPLPDLSDEDRPFSLPKSWAWVRLDYLAEKITDGEHLSPQKTATGMPLLTATHVTAKGVTLNNPQFVSIEDGHKCRQRCDPRRGDILICSRGTIGRCAVVNTDETFCLMGSVILVRFPEQCTPAYINYFLSTDRAQLQMGGMSGATAVHALYLKDIRLCPVAVPPLAEQHRIVAKVDELMTLCDELGARISNTTAARRQLLEANLHEALFGRPELNQEAPHAR